MDLAQIYTAHAVLAQPAPAATELQQAGQIISALKSDAARAVQFGSALLTSSPPPQFAGSADVCQRVQFTSMQLLGHAATQEQGEGQAVRSAARAALFQVLASWLQAAGGPPSQLVAQRLISAIIDSALIDWPTGWPDLLPQLLALAEQPGISAAGQQFAQQVLGEVMEGMAVSASTEFYDNLSVARRDDVLRGLHSDLGGVLSVLHSVVQSQWAAAVQSMSTSGQPVISAAFIAAMKALAALAQWIPSASLRSSGIFTVMEAMITTANGAVLAASDGLAQAVGDGLVLLSTRAYDGADEDVQMATLQLLCAVVQQLADSAATRGALPGCAVPLPDWSVVDPLYHVLLKAAAGLGNIASMQGNWLLQLNVAGQPDALSPDAVAKQAAGLGQLLQATQAALGHPCPRIASSAVCALDTLLSRAPKAWTGVEPAPASQQVIASCTGGIIACAWRHLTRSALYALESRSLEGRGRLALPDHVTDALESSAQQLLTTEASDDANEYELWYNTARGRVSNALKRLARVAPVQAVAGMAQVMAASLQEADPGDVVASACRAIEAAASAPAADAAATHPACSPLWAAMAAACAPGGTGVNRELLLSAGTWGCIPQRVTGAAKPTGSRACPGMLTMEAAVSVVTAITAVAGETKIEVQTAQFTTGPAAQPMLDALMQWLPGLTSLAGDGDPLLLAAVMQGLAGFASWLSVVGAAAQSYLGSLAGALLMVLAQPQATSSALLQRLHRHRQRRAALALVHLARFCAPALYAEFGALQERALSLQRADPPVLHPDEASMLSELLVLVSNACPDANQRTAFLARVLEPSLAKWTSPELMSALASPLHLLHNTGLLDSNPAAPPPSSAPRDALLVLQNDLWSVRRRVGTGHWTGAAGSQPTPSFAQHWQRMLPTAALLMVAHWGRWDARILPHIVACPWGAGTLVMPVEDMRTMLGADAQVVEDALAVAKQNSADKSAALNTIALWKVRSVWQTCAMLAQAAVDAESGLWCPGTAPPEFAAAIAPLLEMPAAEASAGDAIFAWLAHVTPGVPLELTVVMMRHVVPSVLRHLPASSQAVSDRVLLRVGRFLTSALNAVDNVLQYTSQCGRMEMPGVSIPAGLPQANAALTAQLLAPQAATHAMGVALPVVDGAVAEILRDHLIQLVFGSVAGLVEVQAADGDDASSLLRTRVLLRNATTASPILRAAAAVFACDLQESRPTVATGTRREAMRVWQTVLDVSCRALASAGAQAGAALLSTLPCLAEVLEVFGAQVWPMLAAAVVQGAPWVAGLSNDAGQLLADGYVMLVCGGVPSLMENGQPGASAGTVKPQPLGHALHMGPKAALLQLPGISAADVEGLNSRLAALLTCSSGNMKSRRREIKAILRQASRAVGTDSSAKADAAGLAKQAMAKAAAAASQAGSAADDDMLCFVGSFLAAAADADDL